MATIDQLSVADSIAPQDKLPLYSAAQTDTRATTVEALTNYIDSQIVVPADQALRDDLASTATGKGASLVGLTQGSTVQTAIDYVTPQMFGATGDGTVHYLNEICGDDTAFRLRFPYAWALKEKYLWTRANNNAIDGGITFPGGVTVNDLTIDWAALAEVGTNPNYKHVVIPPATYVVTDFLPMESKDKHFSWGGATIKNVRKATRGNVMGFFEAYNVSADGILTVDANYIFGDNAFTVGQALLFATSVDDSLFPPGIVATGSEIICRNINVAVRCINARWKDAQPGRAGGKGATFQQGFTGCTLLVIAEDCDIGLTVEGRDSFTNINATSTEPFIAGGNVITLRARDCQRAGIWLAQPTTPRPTNPLNHYGIIDCIFENCATEYGGLFGVVSFDRGSGWDVRARIAQRIRKDEWKQSFDPADVDAAADTITNIDASTWFTGNPVIYSSTGELTASNVGGLTNGTRYFVIKVNDTTVKLATTRANALAGTAINLTGGGTASGGEEPTHFLENVSTRQQFNFAPSDVNTTTSRITIPNHGFRNGFPVEFETTGTLPTGIATGTTYYVSIIDANTIELAYDYEEAVAPVRPNVPVPTADINIATDQITITGHPFSTGDSVYYIPGSTGITVTLESGSALLSSPVKLVVIRVDANTIKLAETSALASAGTAIDITNAGAGTHILGSAVPLTSTGSGTHTLFRNRAAVLLKGTPSFCDINISANVDSLLHAWDTQNYPDGSNHTLSQPTGNKITWQVNVRGETYGAMIRERIGATASPGGGVDGSNMRITSSEIAGMFTGLPSTAEAFYYNTSATNYFNMWDATNLRRVRGRSKSTTNFRSDRTDWSAYRDAIEGSTAIAVNGGVELSGSTTGGRIRGILNNGAASSASGLVIEFWVNGPGIYAGAGTPEGVVTARIGSIFLRSDGGAGTSIYVKQSGTGNTGWVGK